MLPNDPVPHLGDDVGVVDRWDWPDISLEISKDQLTAVHDAIHDAVVGGLNKENQQADDWIGHAIGRVLQLDSEKQPDKSRINKLVQHWIGIGALIKNKSADTKQRKNRPFVTLGDWSKTHPD